MTAGQFIDRLEQTGLLEDKVLAKLRQQVAAAKNPVSPKTIAESLIKAGHLTLPQAKKLLGDGAKKDATPARSAATAAPRPNSAAQSRPPVEELQPLDDLQPLEELTPLEDDLGLSPLDGGGLTPLDDGGLTPLDDGGLTPLDDGGLTPLDDGGLTPLDDGGLTPLDDGGLTPLDDGGLTAPVGKAGKQAAAPAAKAAPVAAKPAKKGMRAIVDTLAEGIPTEKAVRRSVWDSSLLYLGGGALVLMIGLSAVLYFVLSTGTADEMFKAAEDAYSDQSYAAAVDIYTKFIDKYPQNERVSLAKVRRGVAQLRQEVNTRNWDRSHQRALEILAQIEVETAFPEARSELASLLPTIAAGFATQGRETTDVPQATRLAEMAEQSMELVNNPNYIPTSLRVTQETRIEQIREDIALTRRTIAEEAELNKAIEQIDQLVAAGKTVEAFEVRRQLLRVYPGLDVHAQLREAVLRITAKEVEQVRLSEEPVAAATDDAPSTAEFRVTLASRRGQSATGVGQEVLYVLARGAVYGLDAVTGQPLWRRYVGYETTLHPQPIGRESGADALVVDARTNELLRLEARTGKLVWRLPLEGAVVRPVFYNDAIYAGDAAGQLWEIDPATGASSRRTKIPQPLRSPPAIDDRLGQFYVVGEHSNLYVLAADKLTCSETYYLGHAAGTVTTQPLVVRGLVLVVENAGAEYCLLHILRPDAKTKKLTVAQQPVRLDGNVLATPLDVISGNDARVIVLTSLGAVHVYEYSTEKADQPLVEVARQIGSAKEPQLGFHLYDAGQYWVADRRLTKYEIQTTRNQLARQWIVDDAVTFVGPLTRLGKVLYCVRSRAGSGGVSVAAVQAVDGQRIWQTDLATPLAGAAFVDTANRRIIAVNSHSDVFDLDAEALRRGLIDTPAQSYDLSDRVQPFTGQAALPGEKRLFFDAANRSQLLLFDPAGGQRRLATRSLPAPEGAKVVAGPIPLGAGLLMPLDLGQAPLRDLVTGANLLLPFQPAVEAGVKVAWCEPAVLAQDPPEFLIANSQKKLFHIGVRSQPRPHLTALHEANLEGDVVAPLAVAGGVVYGVARNAGRDAVVSFQLPDLAANQDWPLEGLVAWGPHQVGSQVLLATDRGRLLCFAGQRDPQWSIELPYGPIAGAPLNVDGDLVFAAVSGVVWRADAKSGEEVGRHALGEPLGASPVAFGARLVLSGSDGVVHVIPTPPRN